jgi:hypothetical protein
MRFETEVKHIFASRSTVSSPIYIYIYIYREREREREKERESPTTVLCKA